MKVGSLFAGIGGFDLAARWMGWHTAWYSEIEPYACKVMQRHFPDAVNHGDITQIDGRTVEPVDILCGGFPCQDISLAGKGAGLEGERSGLWSHYARLIEEIRPRYVVAENVSALRSRGLDRVLGSLAALGYDAEWHCIPASAVGAPHRRDRIWIIGRANDGSIVGHAGSQLLNSVQHGCCAEGSGEATPEGAVDACDTGCRDDVADTNGAGFGEHSGSVAVSSQLLATECCRLCGRGWCASPRWAVEPNVGRVANGIPSRVDRLRCLGNAIVPQVAHLIFSAIAQHEARLTSGLSFLGE